MESLGFEPLYHGDRLRVLNPRGDVAFTPFWSPIDQALEKLAQVDRKLVGPEGRLSVVGQLYGDGMFAMLCNLLNNPQIRHLISAGQDLSECASQLEAFLAHGTEPVSILGKSMRRIIGTTRYFPDLDVFDEAALRSQLSYKHFGKLSHRGLIADIGRYLADCPPAGPTGPRIAIEIPEPKASDFEYRPSDTLNHQVARRRPLECWRELVVRVMRFGRPVNLGRKLRIELLNTKVIIAEPAEDSAEDLDSVGFDLQRFREYQKRILEPALPEGITYTYGHRLRSYYEGRSTKIDTLAEAIRRLRANPESRHAYISIWDTQSDLPGDSDSDASSPCLATIFFRKIGDQLSLTATYRSHNLLTAWLENVYGLMAIQRHVADGVGLQPGPITVISHSLGADPASTRFSVGQSVLAAWDRDDDRDPQTKKHVLRNDPNGHFALSIDEQRGSIIAEHIYEGILIARYEGKHAEEIEAQISADMAVSLVSHAMWLGRELARKEAELRIRTKV